MSPHKPWWRMERYDIDLSRTLNGLYSGTSDFHARRLRNWSAATWAYERDLYDFDYYPSFLASEFGHWGEDWYRKSPRSNEIFKTVNAATAWLFADQPALDIRANSAPFELRQQIERMSLALTQTIDSTDGTQVMMDVGRDGLLSGFGCVLPQQKAERVIYRRLRARDVWWDPVDAESGDPWTFAVVERWDRTALEAWYRDQDRDWLGLGRERHKSKLQAISNLDRSSGWRLLYESAYLTPYEWELTQGHVGEASDRVLVMHLWRRATSSDADDGRYLLVACEAGMQRPVVLVDAPYRHTELPVVWWSPYPSPSGGLAGIGLAQLLRGHQYANDRSGYQVQQHLDRLGTSKVLVPPSIGEEALEGLSERYGIGLIPVSPEGQQPTVIQPPALRQDHLSYQDVIRRRVQEDSGLGGVIAGGITTLGAGASGVAQVEEAQRQTDRVSDLYSRWVAMRIKVGDRTLAAIEDAVARDSGFRSSFMDQDGSWSSIKWSSLRKLTDGYQVGVEVAGALGKTRKGRVLKSLDLGVRGILPPDFVQDLLMSSPDIQAARDLELAGRRLIERLLAALIDPEGEHDKVSVSRDLDLPLAADLTGKVISKALSQGADFETIERLRNFRAQVEAELAAEQAAQVAAATPAPGLGSAAVADQGLANPLQPDIAQIGQSE